VDQSLRFRADRLAPATCEKQEWSVKPLLSMQSRTF